MKTEERDYLLKIINLQDSALQAYAQQNMSKFIVMQKELEAMKKQPFGVFMADNKEQKRKCESRIDNLLTEIKAVVKELKGL